MATLRDVLDAIDRIEQAGHGGAVTTAVKVEISAPMLPPQEYDRILNRLRAAFPEILPSAGEPTSPPEQQGAAVRAMWQAETALAQQQSATAEFDRQVIQALLHAHETTSEGRRLLDDLEGQIESAARTWDLETAAGARDFQRFLLTKLDQIVQVVATTNDDDTAKRALAAAWTALYAAQESPQQPAAPAPETAPVAASPPQAEAPVAKTDPYFDTLLPDDLEPVDDDPRQHSAAAAPAMPTVPGLGAGMPGAGLPSGGGASEGLPLAGLLSGRHQAAQPDDADSGGEPVPEQSDDPDPDSEVTPEPATDTGPTVVTLPDGETVTVATPQLAAVIRAAAGGTPVAEAFRQQGIIIPPPGTAVADPVEQSRVGPGDIGMFTDRHALAVGNSRALLDGQIQQIANLAGPSFLGWQHPPTTGETPAPERPPTPTRLSTVRA